MKRELLAHDICLGHHSTKIKVRRAKAATSPTRMLGA